MKILKYEICVILSRFDIMDYGIGFYKIAKYLSVGIDLKTIITSFSFVHEFF